MGWTTEEFWFNSQQVQETFSLQNAQTSSEANPTSYSVAAGGSFWGEEHLYPFVYFHGIDRDSFTLLFV